MPQNKIETGFQLIGNSIESLQKALNISFLDAYIENGENIIDDGTVRVMDNLPDKETKKEIEVLYQGLKELELLPEEKRKVSQLVLLKGLLAEPLQPNHQVTPDALGFLFVYIIEQLLPKEQQEVVVNDFTVGAGNLLYTVLLNLEQTGRKVYGNGVDVDDTLLAVAAVNAEWMDISAKLYHQDSLQHLLIDPADFAIGDLPVGYYPDDEHAKTFEMGVTEGHTYAHHLLMESNMNYVKGNGYGIFLVPTDFLETEQSDKLKKWITDKVYLQAILRLPETMFQSKASRKSIIIVQNRSETSYQVKEVLLADLPSLKEGKSMQQFFTKFHQWKSENKL